MTDYHIRQAEPSDTPEILELLKRTMGEALHLNSVSAWNWKHRENPFGASEVLLAVKEGTLIGLRAFMRWEWRCRGTNYKALRAVDTATHPEYRRQGIFRTLTSELVERCREKGYDFIFNNPNEASRPGYLKMGWSEWIVPPMDVQLIRPFRMISDRWWDKKENQADDIPVNHRFEMDRLKRWDGWDVQESIKEMTTPWTREYVHWRYGECPLYTYGIKVHPQSMILYRIQDTRYGPALRICDWKWTESASFDLLCDQWKTLLRAHSVNYALLPRYEGRKAKRIRRTFWMWKHPSINPMMVVRPLNSDLEDLPDAVEWDFSNGILELF